LTLTTKLLVTITQNNFNPNKKLLDCLDKNIDDIEKKKIIVNINKKITIESING